MDWVALAFLSALFAGLTAVLAKLGVQDVPTNLATVVRTVVILAITASLATFRGEARQLGTIPARGWAFLVLSGVATGLSWLCYFAALKRGPVSGVAPIDKLSFLVAMLLGWLILRDSIRPLSLLGAALIAAGVLLTLPGVQAWLTRD